MRIKTLLFLLTVMAFSFVSSSFADDAVQKALDQYGIKKITPAEQAPAKPAAAPATPAPTPQAQNNNEPYKDFAHTNESLVGDNVGDGPGVTPGRWIHNRAPGLDPRDAFDVTVTKADGTIERFPVGPGEWSLIPDDAKEIIIRGGDATSINGGSIFEGDPKFWGHPDEMKHFKRLNGFVSDKGKDIVLDRNGVEVDSDEAGEPDDTISEEDMKWISSHVPDGRDTQFNNLNTTSRPDQIFNLGFPDTIPTLSANFGTPVQEANRDQQ